MCNVNLKWRLAHVIFFLFVFHILSRPIAPPTIDRLDSFLPYFSPYQVETLFTRVLMSFRNKCNI